MDGEKERLLKPLRAQREEFRKIWDEIHAASEEAVDGLLNNQLLSDFLRERETTERLLQQVLEQSSSSIASLHVSLSILRKQGTSRPASTSVANLKVPACPITFNKSYKVEMISMGEASHFWLRLVGSPIQEMEKKLQEFYSPHACLKTQPDIGSYVICYSEGKFNRAHVMEIHGLPGESSKYRVLLVDYGQTTVTSLLSLFRMHEEFCKEPAMALLCTLEQIQPLKSSSFASTKFYYGPRENLTAIFHSKTSLGGSAKPNSCPTYYVSMQKMEISNGCSKIIDVRSLLINRRPPKSVSEKTETESHANQSISTQGVPGSKKKVVSSSTSNFYSDPKYDSKWDRPCYSSATRQPTLSPRRQNVPNGSTSGSSRIESSYFKGSQLDPNAFEFRPASSISTASFMQNYQANQPAVSCSSSRQETANPLNIFGSIPVMPSAVPQPTYRAVSHITPNQPRFNGNQSPIMPIANSLYRPPSVTLRAPGVASFADIESLLKPAGTIASVSTPSVPTHIPAVPSAPVATSLKTPVPAPVLVPPKASYTLSALTAAAITGDGSLSSPQLPPCVVGSDPVLMESFLNSCLLNPVSEVDLSDSISFVTASDQLTIDNGPGDGDTNEGPRILQYDPNLVLEKRPVPEVGSSAFQFCLTCIHSPSSFFIRIDDDIGKDWEQLNETLRKVYGSPTEFSQEVDPSTGSFWVTQDLDGRWRRVVIMEINAQQKSLSVLFVDYGHVTTVMKSALRPLVPEVAHIPSLAVYCKLAGIYPVNEDEQSLAWSDDAIAEFIRLSSQEETHSGLSAGVDLEAVEIVFFDKGNEEELTVNELLVKQGLAASRVFNVREFDGWDPMREDFYSARNTLDLDTENYDSVTAGYVPQDEARICRFFRSTGSCYKGISCSQLHAVPDSRAFTSDTTEIYGWVAPLQQPSPAIGSYVNIKISSVIAANHFYAILCLKKKSRKDEDDIYETIDSLQVALQEEYNKNFFVHRYPTELPDLGDVVVAQNPADGKWYRGRVLDSVRKDGRCQVVFFDFGFVELVSPKKICKPLPRFLYLPVQSFECFLHGVEISDTSKTVEARRAFLDMVSNRKLVAHIVEREPYLLVDLFDSSPGCKNDVDIAKELIAKGVIKASEKKPLGRRLKAAVIAAG